MPLRERCTGAGGASLDTTSLAVISGVLAGTDATLLAASRAIFGREEILTNGPDSGEAGMRVAPARQVRRSRLVTPSGSAASNEA